MTINLEKNTQKKNLKEGKGLDRGKKLQLHIKLIMTRLDTHTTHKYIFKNTLSLLLLITISLIYSTALITAGHHCCMAYAFFRNVECLCMQGVHISELSLRDAISGWNIIQYFSFKHKLQRLDEGL